MRFPVAILLSTILLAVVGCMATQIATPTAPVPQISNPGAVPESGVLTRLQAADAGRQWMLTREGTRWLDGPRTVLVEEMTYEQAGMRIPPLSKGEEALRPPEMLVWLVIVQGRWEGMPGGPPGATLTPNVYDGCLFVLFTARDGSLIATGDTQCPG